MEPFSGPVVDIVVRNAATGIEVCRHGGYLAAEVAPAVDELVRQIKDLGPQGFTAHYRYSDDS